MRRIVGAKLHGTKVQREILLVHRPRGSRINWCYLQSLMSHVAFFPYATRSGNRSVVVVIVLRSSMARMEPMRAPRRSRPLLRGRRRPHRRATPLRLHGRLPLPRLRDRGAAPLVLRLLRAAGSDGGTEHRR